MKRFHHEILSLTCSEPSGLQPSARFWLGLAAATLLAILIGCGGGAGSNALVITSVDVNPKAATLVVGSGTKFTGTVNGGSPGAFSWQLSGPAGENLGTIDSTGLYNAPESVPSGPITITATSVVDSTKSESVMATVIRNANVAPDPLGSVTNSTVVDCASVGVTAGVAGSTCYELTVSCPGVADEDVALKVNTPVPPAISQGTVLYTPGGGGKPWYDELFTFGTDAVQPLIDANFTTVQINFEFTPVGYPGNAPPDGWLSGPGGPRKLACRWATVAQWVHDNLRTPSTAFCATGNSGGAGAGAYSLSHYGLGSGATRIFDFLEETSGPVFTRVDQGCICTGPLVQTSCGQGALATCYLDDAKAFLDPSYSPTGNECSSAVTSHSVTNAETFINDSALSPDANLLYPNTDVHFVFGGLDTGSGLPQGIEWMSVIGAKGSVSADCVADAPHELADAQDGAMKIADDLLNRCHQ